MHVMHVQHINVVFSFRTFDTFTVQKKKWYFPWKISSQNMITPNEEIINEKFHFSCNDHCLLDITCFGSICEIDQVAALLYLHSMVVLL